MHDFTDRELFYLYFNVVDANSKKATKETVDIEEKLSKEIQYRIEIALERLEEAA